VGADSLFIVQPSFVLEHQLVATGHKNWVTSPEYWQQEKEEEEEEEEKEGWRGVRQVQRRWGCVTNLLELQPHTNPSALHKLWPR